VSGLHLAFLENPGRLGGGYKSFDKTYYEDLFLNFPTEILGFVLDNVLVAGLMYYHNPHENVVKGGYLYRLKVASDAGLGRKLMLALLNDCQKNEIDEIQLHVDSHNPAQQLYLACGGLSVGTAYSRSGKLTKMSLPFECFVTAIDVLRDSLKDS
jgi:ribosomal protein S18 acetylase RimI-like enzyme